MYDMSVSKCFFETYIHEREELLGDPTDEELPEKDELRDAL